MLGASGADPSAFEITVCYLRDSRDDVFGIDEQARLLGVRYREIVERQSFDLSVWGKIRDLVRRQHIEIVHSHEYKTNFLAWCLARAQGVAPLATVHGWTGHSLRERLLYYPVDKRLLSRFPRLIAVSSQIRGELIQAGADPNHTTTILNGIDPDIYRRTRSDEPRVRAMHGIGPDEFVIASVGRLEPQKRFDLLMETFARLQARSPNLRLVIVGEGSERTALRTAMIRLGIEATCRLLGHRNDIVSLHHAFDLFVQSSDYEGTPNAVLEAMALETPVVATDAGGTAELVRHEIDGLIVPTGGVDALAAAIERALFETAHTARRVANARQRVETDLSFKARTRKVETIYRELSQYPYHPDARMTRLPA